MKALLISLSILLYCATVSSRLILPSQIREILKQTHKHPKPELTDPSHPLKATSTANPVQGVANATSGYLSVNDPNSESKLFYIFYSCRALKSGQTPKDVPVIVWLQGGPGASSQLGNFYEIGPYTLDKDSSGKYEEVAFEKSWTDYYNLLFIDNPRGVGYSVADKDSYLTTEDEVGDDLLQALLNFYTLDAFSSFAQTPLYIFGESYAGKYIPSISKKVLEYNNANQTPKLPLAGIGIGDGWTDPIHQIVYNGLVAFSLGLVDYVQRNVLERYQLIAIGNIINGDFSSGYTTFDNITETIENVSGVDVYNFRQTYNGFNAPTSLDDFFNDPETAQRYNVDPSSVGTYSWDSMDVYEAFSDDFTQSVADRVAYIADSGLPVLLYNGQYDLVVNTAGAINWIDELKWSGQAAFYDEPLQNWICNNGTVAGIAKNHGNFTFVVVNKAGHTVPESQPDLAIEMLRRFISGNNQWNQPFDGDL